MGLSSSQARLLTLTSRMHQIEYKAAKLEAMKLQMANESRQVYEEYLDAMEKTKVQVKKLNSVGAATYEDITNYATLTGAGYKLYQVNADGDLQEVAFNNNKLSIKTTTTDDDGNEVVEYQALSFGGQEADITDFNTEVLTNLLNSGWFILKKTDAHGDEFETSVAIDTGLQEVSDETLLRKAEAKYEADMRKIDAKDRKYDQDLAAKRQRRKNIQIVLIGVGVNITLPVHARFKYRHIIKIQKYNFPYNFPYFLILPLERVVLFFY